MSYQLHERLQADTWPIGQFALCDVLLMNDARYPWVILVPRRPDITESYQLSEPDQQQLMQESAFVAKQLATLVEADKMNVAALGNVVSQLHIHHIARYQSDDSWPAPVWGRGDAVLYLPQEIQALVQQLRQAFERYLLQ